MRWKAQLLLLFLASVGQAIAADEINHALVFPQVVQGVFGPTRITTELLIINPGSQIARVHLTASGLTFEGAAFELTPGESRPVLFASSAAEVGWVRLSASCPVVAHARLLAKTVREAELVSELAYAAVERGSKWVIPIYDLASDADVALAIAVSQIGVLRISLFTESGQLMAQRELVSNFGATHPTVSVRQFFPESGTKSLSGRLVLQASPDVALAFSVLAVQIRKSTWTSLPTSLVDVPGTYLMILGPGGDPSALAHQYGFEVVDYLPLSFVYVVRMTHEVARAVSRDPGVGYMQVDAIGSYD